MNGKRKITFAAAMIWMRLPDRRLIRTNRKDGTEFLIVPGGKIDAGVAAKVIAHPLVAGEADALWPDLSQTWRIPPLVPDIDGAPNESALSPKKAAAP